MTTGDNVLVKIEPPAGSKAMGSHFATDPDMLPRRMVSSGTQTSPPKSSNMLNVTPGRKRKSGATAATTTPKTSKFADTKSSKGASTSGFDSQVCQICFRRNGTNAEYNWNSEWIKCSHSGCNYWVHIKCKGFYPKATADGGGHYELFISSLDDVDFFGCPDHPPPPPEKGDILRRTSKKWEIIFRCIEQDCWVLYR